MKTPPVLIAVCLILGATGTARSVPYNVDSHTLHLYHFDGDGRDSATTNPIDLVLDSGATATDVKIPGLGQALHTYEGTNRTNVNLPSAMATTATAIRNFVGADGAFTFEALVCPAFGPGSIPNNMQIISGEHDSTRGWQFRVTTAAELAFIKLTGTIQTIATPLPTTGPHVLAANQWFHAAVTYDGRPNTDGNLKLYWTALDSGVCQPVLLGSFRMTASLDPAVTPNFVIGNEGRSGNGRTENWEGWIDEARISDIARSPSDMAPCLETTSARNPDPADHATDVPADAVLSWAPGDYAQTHDVYLGTVLADVNAAARANPLNVLVSLGQDANRYDPPAPLALGQTYYWRVDEINAPPAATVFKGKVWSFTVEPPSYPMPTQNITATASSASTDMGPDKTIDGSGLNERDEHSTDPTCMWLSSQTGPQPTWIQYAFDHVYKLDQMQVWNSNQLLEPMLGFGARNVTIECSADASNWTTLGDFELARAPGMAGYAANTTVKFSGAVAQYVRLTLNSNWGGIVPQYGLGEVRFFYIPTQARQPEPAPGTTGVELNSVLSWRSGRDAASHQVFFGTDQQAVAGEAVAARIVAEHRFDPGPLGFGQTYYWKVAEVNEAAMPQVWTGELWSFSTREFAVIDDFESYTDQPGEEVFSTWIDGFTNGLSGSTVGYFTAAGGTFGETTILHGGRQSMPFEYNNVNPPFYSEAEREFSPAQDWTLNGADTLSLWVRGQPPAHMEDAGVVTMSAAGHDIWDNADDFRFACKSLTGNGSIVVKVESLVNTNAWAKAGVMIRQSLDADSKFAYAIVSCSSGVSFGWRQQTAGTCGSVTQTGVAAPQWVKLTRTGDAFTAQYSADGKTWLDLRNADGTVATTTVAMTGPVSIGLCVTSHNTAATTTAVMSAAATTGSVTGSWQVAAIGDDPQPANSPADLYLTVQDATGKTATVTHPTAATTAAWTQWKIPLTSLAGVNVTRVKKLTLGVGNRSNPAPDGSGILYFDDIGYGHPLAPGPAN
jgi:regulation of enolase protein 1 (concanavalin A-like superfamily)